MTDDFTGDALRYLLGEMEPEQHRAFTQRLARDPVAAQAFKTCADSLSGFALSCAQPTPVSESEREASLAGVLIRLAPKPASQVRLLRVFPLWLWPIAAVFFLLLNLLQWVWFRPPVPNPDPPAAGVSAGETGTRDRNDPAANSSAGIDATETTTQPLSPSVAATSRTSSEPAPSALVAAEADRLEQLRREYAVLRQARETLDADYNQALRQLAGRVVSEQGAGRLAAMELVDANSYARGDRKGLTNLARDLLTEPGFASAVPAAAENAAVGTGLGIAGGGPRPGTMPGAAPSDPPYAWSVYDEKENRGYLNLYNLPLVAATEILQVWVKPADRPEFQAVGQVPAQFHGRSGSVTYELPAGSTTPAEVLITVESRQNRPARPTGPVVLRGP